jgi:hypothetical protein
LSLYLNDDFLIWNKVEPKTFFEKNKTRETSSSWKGYGDCQFPVKFTDNNIIVSDLTANEYQFKNVMAFNQKLISKYLNEPLNSIKSVQHVPFGNIKSLNKKLDEFLDTILFEGTNINEHTKMSKFRKNTNIAQVSLFRKYWYKKHNSILKFYGSHKLINITKLNRNFVNRLLHSKKHFFSFNNDINYHKVKDDDDNDIKQISLLKLLFESKFPFPSSFEK